MANDVKYGIWCDAAWVLAPYTDSSRPPSWSPMLWSDAAAAADFLRSSFTAADRAGSNKAYVAYYDKNASSLSPPIPHSVFKVAPASTQEQICTHSQRLDALNDELHQIHRLLERPEMCTPQVMDIVRMAVAYTHSRYEELAYKVRCEEQSKCGSNHG